MEVDDPVNSVELRRSIGGTRFGPSKTTIDICYRDYGVRRECLLYLQKNSPLTPQRASGHCFRLFQI